MDQRAAALQARLRERQVPCEVQADPGERPAVRKLECSGMRSWEHMFYTNTRSPVKRGSIPSAPKASVGQSGGSTTTLWPSLWEQGKRATFPSHSAHIGGMCARPTMPAPICDREAIVKSSAKALSYVEYRRVYPASKSRLFPLNGYPRSSSSEIHSRDVRTGANTTAADCESDGGACPDGHGLL